MPARRRRLSPSVVVVAQCRRPTLSDVVAAQQRPGPAQSPVVSARARRRRHPPLMDPAEVASPALRCLWIGFRSPLHRLQLGGMRSAVIPLPLDLILTTCKALNSLETDPLSVGCMTCLYTCLYDRFESLRDEHLSVGCTCPYTLRFALEESMAIQGS